MLSSPPASFSAQFPEICDCLFPRLTNCPFSSAAFFGTSGMVTIHRPALPEAGQDHLPAETSIHLLRLSNSILEVNESFGDDILWHIAVGARKPPLVGPRDFVSDQ